MALSEKARFLYDAVLKPQTDAEKARRFFPMLRKWAETGKEYRGEVYSSAEVEEAIAAFERSAAPRNVPSPQQQKTEWWPRWALNKARGVEVLAPLKGKTGWTQATPIALGYSGQKKCFLFVRSESFEMDCRRSEVRPVGGGRTAQQQMEDLISRGHRPENHKDWTDGSDITMSDKRDIKFIRPGLPPRSKQPDAAQATGFAKAVDYSDLSLIYAFLISNHCHFLAVPRLYQVFPKHSLCPSLRACLCLNYSAFLDRRVARRALMQILPTPALQYFIHFYILSFFTMTTTDERDSVVPRMTGFGG